MADDADLTLSQATDRFLHSLDTEERVQIQTDLQRFLRWHGGDRLLSEMRPADLEGYTTSVTTSAVNGRRQLSAVRSFLAYAKRAGLTRENLSTHVRLARVSDRGKAGTPTAGPVVRLTPEGFVQLERELEELRGERPRLAEDLRLAMADKDFRENAPLDAAREQQAHLEARVRDIEHTLRHAVVMRPEERSGQKAAQVGATVRLHDLASGSQTLYTLVERSEVDPSQGKISIDSPVGQALVGRRPGDEIEVQAPSGVRKFRLEEIQAM